MIKKHNEFYGIGYICVVIAIVGAIVGWWNWATFWLVVISNIRITYEKTY